MRNTKKYINKLFNAGIELQNGGVYWLNGDASLKASQRQKFRKFIGWLEKLPERLENEFNFDKKIHVNSSYCINDGNEQMFSIYGYTLSDIYVDQYVFEIKTVVNDLDESEGIYTDHWEGFKKWLKELNINHLDNYLDDWFKKIEITVDDEGDYNISHSVSVYGIQGLIDFLYDEDRFNPERRWEFKDNRVYTGYRNFIGCYHESSNKDIIFWESASNRLLALEVWYKEDTTQVINYSWSELYSVEANPDDNYESWIYRWDSDKQEDLPVTKYKFN